MRIVISKYDCVRLLSENSTYELRDGERIIETGKVSKEGYIEVYQDLYDDIHVVKVNSFRVNTDGTYEVDSEDLV